MLVSFFIPRPDTSLHCKTPVYYQLSLILTAPTHEGMARQSWWLAAQWDVLLPTDVHPSQYYQGPTKQNYTEQNQHVTSKPNHHYG